MARIRFLLAALFVGVLLLGACGDDDDAASDPAPVDDAADDAADDGGDVDDGTSSADGSEDAGDDSIIGPGEVAIQDFDFVLQPVAAGSEITFANFDGASHTLTADDGSFDTGTVVSGDSVTFTVEAPGEYGIFCIIHPSITDTLVVE